MRRAGDRVRITVQLIRVSNQTQVWAESFERDFDDLFALQNEVAARVTRTLRLELLPEEQARLRSTRPANVEAYEAFLRGRYYDIQSDQEKLVTAIEHYEEAVRLDPGYALAYAALAHAWGTLGWADYIPVSESYEKQRQYTRKAAELDPDLAEVQVLFAEDSYYDVWDWATAEAGFRRAYESAPGSQQAVWHYAIYLSEMGRFEEAIVVAERGLELNPHSRVINGILASAYRNARQYERAIEQYRKIIGLVPNIIIYPNALGNLYEDLGRDDEALDFYVKARSLAGDGAERVQALRDAYGTGGIRGYWRKHLEQLIEAHGEVPPLDFARIYARLDETDKALGWVRDLKGAVQLEHVSPFDLARIYTHLGENDQALGWLETAFEQRSRRLTTLKIVRLWDPLRDEPRFQDLLRRMNFPD